MRKLLRLGTSGWSYKDWVGNFYPAKLPAKRWLEHYVQQFNTVEVDSTFYGIPPRARVRNWAAAAPDGFEFALKVPRIITHDKQLTDCDRELAEFVDVAGELGEHCGPLLFQFPYSFKPDQLDTLLRFLDTLPRGGFRFVVEIRNRAWYKSPLPEELAARAIPLCWVDHPWMPRKTPVTGEFVYLRFLGDQEKITEFDRPQIDRRADLQHWADQAQEVLRGGRVLYGFFNNHFAGHAPTDARAFAELLKQYRTGADA